MKIGKISIVAKHGQWYARWRGNEKVLNKNGKLVRKQYFEPTGVPVFPPGSDLGKIALSKSLAIKVALYLKELSGPNPPPAALQQTKLKEFALESAGLSDNSLKQFAPIFLIDYATKLNRHGELSRWNAVWTMANSWNLFLQGLEEDADKHPSLIDPSRLQTVVDDLPGKQARHAINIRAGFNHAVDKGWILEGHNPASRLKIKQEKVVSHLPYRQASIQWALKYMEGIPKGEQWQLLTLCGVYTPLRFATACVLKIRPLGFIRPENQERGMAVLDLIDWTIDYYDSKAHVWQIEIVSPVLRAWLEPYIAKHQLKPGDAVLPEFGHLHKGPSARWQKIMEDSGCQMQYAKTSRGQTCRTGYHSLRISWDRWMKENEFIAMTAAEIARALRHGESIHETYYIDSETPNRAQQKKVHDAMPKFLPGDLDVRATLSELEERKRLQMAALQGTARQIHEIQQLIATQKKP